ncbi:unnamed protein product [Cochlearia groenlandica]
MQVSSMMSFGPKTFAYALKLPICPLRIHRNNTLSNKYHKRQEDSFIVMDATSGDIEFTRPLAQFTPTVLGDHFFSSPANDSEFDEIKHEIEYVMKPQVRDMLMSSHRCDKEKIRLIHLLISLAISHYFENEIEQILSQAFSKLNGLITDEDDLEIISIMFEVFRLYGHKMSCDVFERFKGGKDGKFKEILVGDYKGILQLYEASYLKTKDEDIMEEARSFTRHQLAKIRTPTHLSKHIQNALYIPRYHCVEIAVTREYISFYEQEEDHEGMLLKFAKLNFRYCQLHYLQELEVVTKWWKELDLASKLPNNFRDRTMELYFGMIGIFFEPRYSLARIIATKVAVIMTLVDDIYDAYATLPEVISFTDALQRWDIGDNENLPKYMQIIFQVLWGVIKDIEHKMNSLGKFGSVQATIDEIKSLTKEYLEIAKWARAGHVPSFKEYMEVGITTAGMDDMVIYSFIGMDDCDDTIVYEWFASRPKFIIAFNAMLRLVNDIATFDEEFERGEVANGVNCYMKDHGVSKEDAIICLRKVIKDHHEIMMDEFFNEPSTVLPRQIRMRVFNLARVVKLFYKEGDGFGHPNENLKAHFTCLFS